MKAIWKSMALLVALSPGHATAGSKADIALTTESASAESPRPRLRQKLSMDEAVRLALVTSPVIRGAEQEVAAAVGRVRAARAERAPWASAHTFAAAGSAANIVSSPDPVQPRMLMGLPGGRFVDQNLSLMVPLFTGGRLQAMARQARDLQAASAEDLRSMRQEVSLMVRLAYREAQVRAHRVQVYQANLDQHRERQRIDQVAFDQEKIPRYYLLRDAAEVANGEQELTYARRDLDLSMLELKTLMGIHLGSELELTEPLEHRPLGEVLTALGVAAPDAAGAGTVSGADPVLDRLLERAEAARPELTAATRRAAAGRGEVEMARSAFRPQVSAGIMADWASQRGEPSFGGSTFTIVGSLSLFDGGARRAKVDTARADARRMEAERQQVVLKIAQEVASSLLSLRAAEANLVTARAALASADEDYRVAQLRYSSGKGINLEALDALAALTRAQNNELQALLEHHVARDRLAYALGELSPRTGP